MNQRIEGVPAGVEGSYLDVRSAWSSALAVRALACREFIAPPNQK